MGFIDFITIIATIIYNYIKAFISLFFPPARKSVAGEIVLVTGAGHGIGRELALEFGKLGATVVVWDINKENNEKTAEDINSAGGSAFAYVCDITSTSLIRDVAAKVRADVGEITILINNAGILNGGKLLDLEEADIRRTFEINTLSRFWTTKQFLPSMIRNNHGHILNVVSMASFVGCAYLTDYCGSKYADMGFTEALIEELSLEGHSGIRVSSLCPMFVDTGLVKVSNEKVVLLTPKEVAVTAVDGMLRNYELITVPTYLWITNRIPMLFPRKTNQFLKKSAKLDIDPQYRAKKQN